MKIKKIKISHFGIKGGNNIFSQISKDEKIIVDFENKLDLELNSINKLKSYFFTYYFFNLNLKYDRLPYFNYRGIINLLKKIKFKNFFYFNLDYSISNMDLIKEYLNKNFKNIQIKTNKPKFSIFLFKLNYKFLIFIYLIRVLFLKKLINYPKALFITNYDRYFLNEGFFSIDFFGKKTKSIFKKKFKLQIIDYKIIYSKIGFSNIFKYLINLRSRGKNNLFLEDFLDFKIGLKLLFKKIEKENLQFEIGDNFDWYFNKSFNSFEKYNYKFFLWFYLSIKKFSENNDLEIIIGDCENNFLFFMFNLVKNFENKNYKTISYSHDTIQKDKVYPSFKKIPFYYPDFKFVWSNYFSDLYSTNYNFSKSKLGIFPDPRFLKWKRFKLLENSILLLSVLDINYYSEILLFLKTKHYSNLKEKGFRIYIKPHPVEFEDKSYLKIHKKLKDNKEINFIDNLIFIPKFVVGNVSIMLLELKENNSIPIFYSKKNIFNLEEKYFKKHQAKDLNQAISFILNK